MSLEIFRACEGYIPDLEILGSAPRKHKDDCTTCARQYRNHVCAVFRRRMLRALAREAMEKKL